MGRGGLGDVTRDQVCVKFVVTFDPTSQTHLLFSCSVFESFNFNKESKTDTLRGSWINAAIVTNKRNTYVNKRYFSNYYPNFLSIMCVMFLCVWNLYKYSKHVDENNIRLMKGEDAHTTC